ncbi:MAG TPA: carbon-nitrogen hydrolase family protein [Candidatus Avalokitesvara rifleensis]|uniref:carbon-nitrogen hydrolase family protein n=1 Tax=Candidatus Avalokitesvara rifleensis TaxID=3367620 RepID=UPI002712443A|nr:carbon-nitrogen hydrolase family protein [Candidatus Brocadiales bacterium]
MQRKHILRVAAIQLSSLGDKGQNTAKAVEFIDTASEYGARLVILPEMFNCYSTLSEMVEKAEPVPGPTINTLAQKARSNNIYILCGSIIETAIKGKGFNTSVMIGPRGDILGIYRKVHLFDVDIPERVHYKESERILPGNEIVVVNVDGWVVGLAICYDLRFPELFCALTSKGAELVLIPSAFAAHTGKDHWEILLRARAIENQVFIVAPNRFGACPNNMATYGRSMVVDPWGTILSQASDKVCVILSELDISILEEVRENIPMKRQKIVTTAQ